MHTPFPRAALAVLLSLAVVPGFQACVPGPEAESGGEEVGVGDADVGVAALALSFADVAKVTVGVTGPGIATPIVADLKKVQGQWRGTIGKIPVGPDRTFAGNAYDASDQLLYTGQVTDVTIAGGAPVTVLLVFQQATPSTPFANSAPRIASVVLSKSQVEPGQPASFMVSASDPDGDPLSYAWTASGGSFTNGATASPTWTAPPADGAYSVAVSVTDDHGGQAGPGAKTPLASSATAPPRRERRPCKSRA